MSTLTAKLSRAQWRQAAWITGSALAIFLTFRWLPTGTNLNHMDFRVDARNSIDFCDPANPQFVPVVTAVSPVTMTLTFATPPVTGQPAEGTLVLRTSSGKVIEPVDLLLAHTKLLHLLIADPTLTDYQHVHPEPGRTRGEWTFSFTPRLNGVYRIFADFTPVATARSLYSFVDVTPTGSVPGAASAPAPGWIVAQDGYRFMLEPASLPVRAGKLADLTFSIVRADGGPVAMGPVMGAYAHLVAFDDKRSGFAHLHPMETDLAQLPDAHKPVLHFKITIPRAGRYVIWAQVVLADKETFVPFWFDVAP